MHHAFVFEIRYLLRLIFLFICFFAVDLHRNSLLILIVRMLQNSLPFLWRSIRNFLFLHHASTAEKHCSQCFLCPTTAAAQMVGSKSNSVLLHHASVSLCFLFDFYFCYCLILFFLVYLPIFGRSGRGGKGEGEFMSL